MSNVSRETVPAGEASDRPPDDVVHGLFHDDEAIHRYVDMLTSIGVERGLLGPREAPRIWSRHILNCVVVACELPAGAAVCDIGSGAGLPGVVWALARPDCAVTLVEPLLRRATFLSEVVDRLGLARVEVRRQRAEDLASPPAAGGLAGRFDVVTARAVTALPRLLDLALPLLRPGGRLLALKGASAADEVAEAAAALARWRVASVDVVAFGAGIVEPATTVVRIESAGLPRSNEKRVR